MILVLNCGSQSIKYKLFKRNLKLIEERKIEVKNQKVFHIIEGTLEIAHQITFSVHSLNPGIIQGVASSCLSSIFCHFINYISFCGHQEGAN